LQLVAIDQLKDGLTLGEDVRDINGRLLLTKGKSIDANHIRLLKIWGVPEVQIQETYQAAAENCEQEIQKLIKIEHTVKAVLQNLDTHHPAIHQIYKTAIEHRYRNDLWVEPTACKPLAENFRLELSSGLKTQIAFTEVQLPESPQIISKFNSVAEDPFATVNDIADVVSRSPSLAALVLKIANSAAFGLPSKIDTISRAMTLLGTREVGTMAMGISIMRLFQNISKDLVDMATFLRHSLACGILSRIITAQANLPYTERMFAAGLLHDIGRLVWYRYFPEQAKLVLQMAKTTGISLYELEKECLGIGHEQIAAQLLQKWQLPDTLVNNIVHHHCPSCSPQPAEPGIVHIADIAVNALGLGHSGEHIIARFEPMIWNLLGIAPSALITAMNQTVQQLETMEALFEELHDE
jgi:putative nucleotidyltransferase with HDIG domain